MLKRRATLVIALVALLGGFGWALVCLFQLRFASGDVYPEYSSLRADPLGAKVYFESLQQTGEPEVRRNFRAPQYWPDGRVTMFVFGLPWDELDADSGEFRELERFVRNGGRLVITLFPELTRPFGLGSSRTNMTLFKKKKRHESGKSFIELSDEWGFDLDWVHIPRRPDGSLEPVVVKSRVPELAPTLSWHSALVFTNLSPEWRSIYARSNDAVIAERSLGSGAIVLSTDSYFISNEALQKERATKLLAWLAGRNSDLRFDEIHLGVQEQTGIAGLARRYRLAGGVFALGVLAALFVWKNAVSFVPRRDIAASEEVRGRESAAGFTNLLRRAVKPDQLLQAALNEWHKSRTLDRRATPRRVEKIRESVETHNTPERRSNVETYNTISRILNEK
jgi:hypothetical protein